MSKIQTTCPMCGTVFILEAPAELGEEGRDFALKLAKLTACKPCSIFQESRSQLEEVREHNNRIIWEQERRTAYLGGLLKGSPKNPGDLEAKVGAAKKAIAGARTDLLDAVRQLSQLDDARAQQLKDPEMQYTEEF